MPSRKISLSETRQDKQVYITPVIDQGKFNHRLSEFLLTVRAFNQIGLIDNIDKVQRFSHTPVDFPDPRKQFPIIPDLGPAQLS